MLYTVTFPGTITGLRWDLAGTQFAGAGIGRVTWAIVVAREGLGVDTLGIADGNTIYNPEQNCLAFGTFMPGTDANSLHSMGSTKTMRKLMGGDTIQFLSLGNSGTNTLDVAGTIQFFIKS